MSKRYMVDIARAKDYPPNAVVVSQSYHDKTVARLKAQIAEAKGVQRETCFHDCSQFCVCDRYPEPREDDPERAADEGAA